MSIPPPDPAGRFGARSSADENTTIKRRLRLKQAVALHFRGRCPLKECSRRYCIWYEDTRPDVSGLIAGRLWAEDLSDEDPGRRDPLDRAQVRRRRLEEDAIHRA